LNKPVEKEIPYLFVDASYYNVRDEVAGRYKTKALLTVAGIREDGYREILGLKLAENDCSSRRVSERAITNKTCGCDTDRHKRRVVDREKVS